MIHLKEYRGPTLKAGCDLALKHRLYVSGWCLSGCLKSRRDNPVDYAAQENLVMLFLDDAPVALVLHVGYGELMAFCRKSERRKGYASRCVQRLMTLEPNRSFHAGEGLIGGSLQFWGINNVNHW